MSSTSPRRWPVRSSPRERFSCVRARTPKTLHEVVRRVALEHGLSVVATDTGLVDEGAGLGGVHVSWVKPPKVAMLVDRPASPYAGHTWYLFDQVWKYPLTRVPGSALSDLDLSKYNVLILPDGRYPGPLGEPFVARLKDWVRSGGTLILVKGAAAWATEKSVGLLREQTGEEGRQDRARAGKESRREGRKAGGAAQRPSRTARNPKNRPTRCRGRFCVHPFTTTTSSRSAHRARFSR